MDNALFQSSFAINFLSFEILVSMAGDHTKTSKNGEQNFVRMAR